MNNYEVLLCSFLSIYHITYHNLGIYPINFKKKFFKSIKNFAMILWQLNSKSTCLPHFFSGLMADFWCPNFPMMVTNLITKYYPRAPNASSPPTWKHPIGWAVWKRSIQHFVAMVLSKWGRNVIVGLFCNVLQQDLVVDRPPAQKISLLVKFLVTKVAYCNKKCRK